MKRKKQFIAPRVSQVTQVQLERDFLAGPSVQQRMTVSAMQQDLEVFDFTPGTEDDPNEFTAEWD
jgi:hypothetical protein